MKAKYFCTSLLALLGLVHTGYSQTTRKDREVFPVISSDTIKKGKYTLVFVNKSPGFDQKVTQQLIDAFFTVYPKQAKQYNKNTLRQVKFVIDPAYTHVAAAGGGVVTFNPVWFAKNPQDIDVVTHETMHIVQSYPHGSGPGWITEGIADYVRYKMGINNQAANWKLPEYSSSQKFDNSYRVTARFFVWIENHYDKKFVLKLDKVMREKTYTADFAKQHTGKTFEELWQEYSSNSLI